MPQREARHARRRFWLLWAVVLVAKIVVAARLPLFVDEAFYWQEGRHLAAAYSDLPGLTAWLTRLGVELGGATPLAVRMPFLLLGALVPWMVARLAAREFGEAIGWTSGVLALLLPPVATLGLLALPDAPMAVATVLSLDAGARLLRGVRDAAALQLAIGLAIGALCHYRFVAVIGVGALALLALPEGRRALRDVRVWIALALGAAAWTPLLVWNLANAEAGLRFQLVERHPWTFHPDGLWFVAVQALLLTPLLALAMAQAALRARGQAPPAVRFLALCGAGVVLGFFALGFFADTERVSFHWPLPGYLALLPLLPAVLAGWRRGWRLAAMAIAALGLFAALAWTLVLSQPAWRAALAAQKWYPSNFVGWDALADAVRTRRAAMPAATRIVADNFKIGAQLGFALGDPRIAVLDHPLNRAHGRAPQLRLWGLETRGRADWNGAPVLLVVGVSEPRFRDLHAHYRSLCARVGTLPPPTFVTLDHGRQRFALFALPGTSTGDRCVTPSIAWVDVPAAGTRVPRRFDVRGWAFKDGAGLARIEVTLDGRVVAEARAGLRYDGLERAWPGLDDPNAPLLGFEAMVDAASLPPGRHWLGLRLHGADGSVEPWPEQPVHVE